MTRRTAVFLSCSLIPLAAGLGHAAAPAEALEHFEREVRPLLIDNCYECHSAEKKIKGGLRLDHRAGWETGGDSGPAIVPGDAETSLIARAISYTDRDLKMPPKRKLSESQIETLRQWIVNGAVDPRDEAPLADTAKTKREIPSTLWSFQPLAQPTPETRAPKVSDPTWPRDPIDHHLLAAMDEAGIQPVNDAAPEALLRRIHFDLTGLPPAAEDLSSFANRHSSLADIVDTLLATPAFAERWAQHWLDITRFAESSGGGRTLPFKDAWRFRDYVIESIHHNVPLDQMIVEQIAGDLLAADSNAERRRQLSATAFLALGPTNYEEQDKGMLRMDIIDEQLEVIGRSFMGMTLGCARCHDHKFDPVTTRDYYALAGIFRSTQTLRNYTDNVAHWVDTALPLDEELEQALKAKEARLASLKSDLEAVKARIKELQPEADALPKRKPIAPEDLPGLVIDDSQAERVGPWVESTHFPSYVGTGYIHDGSSAKGECTATFTPQISEAGVYEVRVAYTAADGRAQKVPIQILHADGEEELFIDQSQTPPIDARFISLGRYRFEKDGAGFILVSNKGTQGVVTLDAVWLLGGDELAREDKTRAALSNADLTAALDEQRRLQKEIKTTESTGPQRQETMSVLEDEAPADCPIHIRGNIRNLGPSVPRGFIQAVALKDAPVIPSDQSGRLQFAEWITRSDNPLTARVLVNRVWMHLFGEGLVRSVDNFGASGELPSHPLLLDHLAHDFIADGWNLKNLIRRLVLTRAYQLASLPADDTDWRKAREIDPENKLLWRAHRRRLDAHALRDTMLTVSGKMDTTFMGPNVQADSVDSNSGAAQNLEYDYVFQDTRRSLYTPAFRNKRLEMFEVFDFADINGPIGQRTRSTIAPQALYFLNHPFVIQQSRATAERLLADTALTTGDARLAWLWHSLLGRAPTPTEHQRAIDFVTVSAADDHGQQLENYTQLIQTLFATADFRFLD
ncbi:MAG: DUF1553 domain-containing protein [Verrucomicrobiales bacterium]|nr:DUF1553 domain-containing protein [Verrucomicrobiales bacterium]